MVRENPDLSEETFVEQLVQFCRQSTHGRDPSHGEEHMTQVRRNAIMILDALISTNEHPHILTTTTTCAHVRRMVQACAQFHDIADHKYVTDPSQCGLVHELNQYFSREDSDNIVRIMEAVSFSRERKQRTLKRDVNTPICFKEELGEVGALVRDIVSDADKLEAIGEIGVQRCLQYASESIQVKEKRAATDDELLAHLVEHAEEKLLILLSRGYIRTSAGREMAAPKHRVMLELICEKLAEDKARRFRKLYA